MDLQPPLLSCLKRFTGAKPHHGSSTVRLLRALVPSRGGAENIRTTHISLSLCVYASFPLQLCALSVLKWWCLRGKHSLFLYNHLGRRVYNRVFCTK
jgi:hypothetical protein